ncbi:MAG: CNNM domain-containing protein [Verrucomicrobia bacterium]|nr:CNNM domain-containing protein [Verrucomicrobiota bacterium]
MIGVSRVRVRHAADDGDKLAERLAQLLKQRQELLRAAMTAHHFCSITAFGILALLCHKAMGPWGFLLAAVIAVPVYIIGLELAPKAWFRLFPFRTLRRLTFVLTLLRATTLPWRIFARKTSTILTDALDAESTAGVLQLSDNIISLKLLPENAAALLSNYAKFSTLHAKDVALPLDAVSAMPAEMPLTAVLQIAAQSSVRHHPVLDEKGAVIGFLDAAGLPPDPPRDRFVRQFTQPAPHVAPADPALRCLQILRKSAAPLATVANGSPHVSSLVVLEPLLIRLMNISETVKSSTRKPV